MNRPFATVLTAALLAVPTTAQSHTPDLVDTAVAAGSFTTLAEALQAADLVGALKGDGPFTVLAPTDEAFAKLPEKTLASLLKPQNKDQLARILTYHVIAGSVTAGQAVVAKSAPTLSGETVRFAIRDGRLVVNDSRVINNDIEASNGIIHVIDTVLLPPEKAKPRGPKLFGFNSEAPRAALAAQLGIDRGETVVVTSVSKGSEAEKSGLQRYDVIVRIGDQPGTGANRAKERSDYGEVVDFVVIRGGERKHLKIAVGEDKH